MRRLPSIRRLALAAALGTVIAGLPLPAVALSAPETLTTRRALGTLEGAGPVVDPAFPVDHLGLSWVGGAEPWVRFRHDDGWGPWTRAHEDEIPVSGGRAWSRLLPAGDADAYQVRGEATDVRAVTINTTDGPRSLVWGAPEARAAHIPQPLLVSRAGWGADESLRFEADGTERGARTFHPTGKLIVHHTATANDDPDPAATVRAIYQYHVVERGFLDIAYNFLVDAQGTIYKGRYSGPQDTADQDTSTGENEMGWGVTGAHTAGWNSGTMGIAVLGTYTSVPIPDAARLALVEHLAWESERHLLEPLTTTTFTNPASGAQRTAPNISGHREWTPTECPGELLFQGLEAIRQEVAARTGQIAAPPPDTKPPRISAIEARRIRRRSAIIRWRTGEPATARVRYWEPGRRRRVTRVDWSLDLRHRMRISGLERGTEYLFVVLSRDAVGNPSQGRQKRFRTDG